ncbi:hypothetical protein ACFL5V_00505 [Fibrobacterota bacterium]
MPESLIHQELVLNIQKWVADTFFKGDLAHVITDLPDDLSKFRPPILFDYIPDIYAEDYGGCGIIVGEAKTGSDLETQHTYRQIHAFLQWCSSQKKATFVLAVPWDLTRAAAWILNRIKNDVGANKVKTIILDGSVV